MSRLAFINQIPDPALQLRVKRLLIDLMLLGEASAAQVGAKGKGSKPEASPPRDPDSLYEHYLPKFAKAAGESTGEVEAVCLAVEEELKSAKGGERWRLEEDDRLTAQVGRSEAKDVEMLIEHLQGEHRAVLAIRHKWPISWINHQRERASQDPVYGVPRDHAFRAMGDEERTEVVQRMQREGLSVRETAIRVGASVGSVQRYRERQEAA